MALRRSSRLIVKLLMPSPADLALIDVRVIAGVNLEQTLKRYAWLYNHHIPQKALHHQSPIAAIKEWQVKRPELFTKRVINHTGRHLG